MNATFIQQLNMKDQGGLKGRAVIAIYNKAATVFNDVNASPTLKAFALQTIMSPYGYVEPLSAMIAVNPTMQAKAVLNDGVINTGLITDEDISTVLEVCWAAMAPVGA